jgi:hypothetical protein
MIDYKSASKYFQSIHNDGKSGVWKNFSDLLGKVLPD